MKIVLKNLGGINTGKAPLLLGENQIGFLQNISPRPFQNYTKRNGVEWVSTSADPILGIFDIELDNVVIPFTASTTALTFFPTLTTLSGSLQSYDAYNMGGRSNRSIDTAGALAQPGHGGARGGGCNWSVSNTAISDTGDGSTVAVTVTTNYGCSWSATSNDSWITLSGSSFLSGGDVSLIIAANSGGSIRSGTVTLATGVASTSRGASGSTFATITVSQAVAAAPSSCPVGLTGSYTLSGGPVTVQDNGTAVGTGSIAPWSGVLGNVATCGWDDGHGHGSWMGKLMSSCVMTLQSAPPRWRVVYQDSTFATYEKTTGGTPSGVYTAINASTRPLTLTVT